MRRVFFLLLVFLVVVDARLEKPTTLRGGGLSVRAGRKVIVKKGAPVDEHKLGGFALAGCIMADLCPHGMLPLAWASCAGGGTGVVPAVLLILLFGIISTYSLYLSAAVAEIYSPKKKPQPKPWQRYRPPPPPIVTRDHLRQFSPPKVAEALDDDDESSDGLTLNLELTLGGPKAPPLIVEKAPSLALSSIWKAAKLPCPLLIDLTVATFCGGCCVFYAAFAADLFHAVAGRLLPAKDFSRTTVLLSLMAFPLIPLSLLDDLAALKYSSFAGLAGILYTTIFVVLQGAKRTLDVVVTENNNHESSSLVADAAKFLLYWPFLPSSGNAERAMPQMVTTPLRSGLFQVSAGSAVLLNTLCVAFMCHYNAIVYYRELDKETPTKYAKVSTMGVAFTALIFVCVMVGGRNAFGKDAMPNVLNNIPLESAFGAVARVGTGLAILSGFPLMFAGFKAAVDTALPLPPVSRFFVNILTLFAVAFCAAVVDDKAIGFTIEILGSTLGCAAAYVIPAIAAARTQALPAIHRRLATLLASAGALLCLGSTYLTLSTPSAH